MLAWRAKNGLTQPEAGKRLGVGKSWISQVENGRPPGELLLRKFEAEESGEPMRTLDHSMNLGVYQAKRVPNAAPAGRLVKVASWAQAGAAVAYEEVAAEWQLEVATDCRDADAVGVHLRGDSMLPIYQEGDVVIIMPSREPRPGCLVVAKFCDDGGICFKVYNEPTPGVIRLTSYNEVFQPVERKRDDFEWIYPVFETKRNVWR